MKQLQTAIFLFLSCFLVLSGVNAQDQSTKTQVKNPQALISFVSGSDVSLIRDGSLIKLQDAIGYEILEADMLQTGKKTYVELALATGSKIRIAENTSFVIKKLKTAADSDFEVLYGKVRAKVSKLSGSDSFVVHSQGTVAGVRGTDFSYETTIEKTGGLGRNLVACFEGSVAVTVQKPALNSKAEAEGLVPIPETVVIVANEMLTVDLQEKSPLVQKSQVDDALRSYWKALPTGDTSKVESLFNNTKKTETQSKTQETDKKTVSDTVNVTEAKTQDSGETKINLELANELEAYKHLVNSKNAVGTIGFIFGLASVGAEAILVFSSDIIPLEYKPMLQYAAIGSGTMSALLTIISIGLQK